MMKGFITTALLIGAIFITGALASWIYIDEKGIGETGKDGTDGKDGKDGSDVDEIVVKELKDTIQKLEDRVKKMPSRIITGRYVHTPMVDRLTAFTDGSTKTFTLSKAPKSVSTMEVFGTDFPIILDPTVDFTVSGKTLTLTDQVSAPSSGATLIAKYFI